MSTQPVEELLHKPYDNPQLTSILGTFADNIDETVNFGTHVLKWSADAATGQPENMPLLMLLRHELGLADSVSVLVRNSCIEPSEILLRSMFETLLAAEYILESDCHRRGLAFRLLQIHDELQWLEKADGSTQVGKHFRKAIQSDKLTSEMSLEVFEVPGLGQRKDKLQAILSSPEFQEVDAEYQRVVSLGRRRPAWHSLFDGPKDIERLAQRLGLSGMYEVLYRSWSKSVHATDILRGKIFPGPEGMAIIAQIRLPTDAEKPTSFSISFCLELYKLFINHYAPGRLTEFTRWYMSSVRPVYQRVSGKTIIQVNPP